MEDDRSDLQAASRGKKRLASFASGSGAKVALVGYALFVVVCFIILLRHGLMLSDELASVAPGLRQGYLPLSTNSLSFGSFGSGQTRRMDLSDAQWRGFRESMLPLAAVFVVFSCVSRALWLNSGRTNTRTSTSATGTVTVRTFWIVVSSIGFLLYLHGRCALYVLGLVTASWVVTRWVKQQTYAPSWARTAAVWAWHVGVLMVVKGSDGFSRDEAFVGVLQGLGVRLGRGVFRWEICYNLTMLRLVSQSLDILWGRANGSNGGTGSLWVSVAHALYPPLYLAGPIVSYKDFAGQLVRMSGDEKAASTTSSRTAILTYALRTAFDVAIIEVMSHYLYFNSVATNNLLGSDGGRGSALDRETTPLDVATCGWWVLAFTWLKFCVIWRFFRLAALLEGITAPENMRKCFAMNYDVQGFWKNWHASFNRWLVEYMYVPAGGRGSTTQLLMVLPIFVFVALWHDVEIRLLGWAGLMVLAFMPELLVKREFAKSRWDWVRREHLTALWVGKALAATVTISSLMVGNMVGFVVGLDGAGAFLRQLLSSPMLVTASLLSFFSAASLMMAVEDWLYYRY